MNRIVLISCVKSKQPHAAMARDLYTSRWFRLAIRYAEMLKPDRVFILSAKYGRVPGAGAASGGMVLEQRRDV